MSRLDLTTEKEEFLIFLSHLADLGLLARLWPRFSCYTGARSLDPSLLLSWNMQLQEQASTLFLGVGAL